MNDNKHGFKAYNPGLVCKGYQYEEGKTFKKNGHGVCVGGVTHYCVNPFYEKTIKEIPSSKVDTGYGAKIGSSGDYAQIDISGNDGVGAAIGISSVIKGAVGNWITLAEWMYDIDKQRNIPICVKSAQIDGENLKADTWYKLSGGEFVEVSDEEI